MLAMGVSYMIIGMSVVFSFLIVLVLSMLMMSAIMLKFFPEKEEVSSMALDGDKDIIAVITAAVKRFESANV
jgi:oxaloacetate decarboxylase (Na+ extruding) subunit gamma